MMVKSVGPAGLERIELKRLTDQVSRLLLVLEEAGEAQVVSLPGAWVPAVDVCETANAISVRIELPGVSVSQVRIALSNTKLCVYGEKRKQSSRKQILSHVCSERNYGHFRRVLRLRWTISVKEATAQLEDGVLRITLPKIKDRRGSEFRIPITEIH